MKKMCVGAGGQQEQGNNFNPLRTACPKASTSIIRKENIRKSWALKLLLQVPADNQANEDRIFSCNRILSLTAIQSVMKDGNDALMKQYATVVTGKPASQNILLLHLALRSQSSRLNFQTSS